MNRNPFVETLDDSGLPLLAPPAKARFEREIELDPDVPHVLELDAKGRCDFVEVEAIGRCQFTVIYPFNRLLNNRSALVRKYDFGNGPQPRKLRVPMQYIEALRGPTACSVCPPAEARRCSDPHHPRYVMSSGLVHVYRVLDEVNPPAMHPAAVATGQDQAHPDPAGAGAFERLLRGAR